MRSWALVGAAFLLATSIGFSVLSGPRAARATPFLVNSTDDAPDAVPGDGICATLSELCTLRAAIMEANQLPGAHTITMPGGIYHLTMAGADEDYAATGDLDIRNELVIIGAGST